MFQRKVLSILLICGGLISIAFAQEDLLGGQATIFDESDSAFLQPVPALDPLNIELFKAGASFFNLYWTNTPVSTTNGDGLAPLFNARSCETCHFKNGRGRPSEESTPAGLLLRLSIPGQTEHGAPLPDPIYGEQLQDQIPQGEGFLKVTYIEIEGTFPDGTPYTLSSPQYEIEGLAYGDLHSEVMFSPRLGTQLIGLGLLEAVSEETLLALADPDDLDGDGISGKINYVWDSVNQTYAVGRFGWKANQPNLLQQVGMALWQDMGITSPLFPQENCTEAQAICVRQDLTEITYKGVLEVTTYVSAIGVPAQRQAQEVLQGQNLFHQAGCSSCHVNTLTSANHTSISVLSNQTFHPYTDLLLHDMGEDLADNRPEFEATGQEWRTPPLWGIGLFEVVSGQTFYLHDGRARNLTEAILWHGGEAEASRNIFLNMTKAEREALLEFLRSL